LTSSITPGGTARKPATAESIPIEAGHPSSSPSLRRFKNRLLFLLAVTTGATDATAFERLGHVFVSVTTANLVLVGVGGARLDGRLALSAGCALAGYVLGVLLAAPRRVQDSSNRPFWPPGTNLSLGTELLLLVAFAVAWKIDGRAPARAAQMAMLALCATAMGVQSSALRRMGQISTTYLTSTLTGVVESIKARRWTPTQARSLRIMLSALGGAAAATVVIGRAHAWLPLLQLLPLTIVELASLRLIRVAESVARGDDDDRRCDPIGRGGR
jgi:uncharacterized membrane protein YoaK (UPF0700 family)